jgi:hypothetical protein
VLIAIALASSGVLVVKGEQTDGHVVLMGIRAGCVKANTQVIEQLGQPFPHNGKPRLLAVDGATTGSISFGLPVAGVAESSLSFDT